MIWCPSLVVEAVSRIDAVTVFPMGAETPLRVDLFDDEIEVIREFDQSKNNLLTWIGDRFGAIGAALARLGDFVCGTAITYFGQPDCVEPNFGET